MATLVETTAILAKHILEKGNRIIKAKKGEGVYKVIWINTNNNTSGLSSRKGSELQYNNEDLKFFIQVPDKAKKVY